MNKLISFKEYIRHRMNVYKISYTENGLDYVVKKLGGK